jgi:hypothetical protein
VFILCVYGFCSYYFAVACSCRVGVILKFDIRSSMINVSVAIDMSLKFVLSYNKWQFLLEKSNSLTEAGKRTRFHHSLKRSLTLPKPVVFSKMCLNHFNSAVTQITSREYSLMWDFAHSAIERVLEA